MVYLVHVCEVEDLGESSHVVFGDGDLGAHRGRELETDDGRITSSRLLLYLLWISAGCWPLGQIEELWKKQKVNTQKLFRRDKMTSSLTSNH